MCSWGNVVAQQMCAGWGKSRHPPGSLTYRAMGGWSGVEVGRALSVTGGIGKEVGWSMRGPDRLEFRVVQGAGRDCSGGRTMFLMIQQGSS